MHIGELIKSVSEKQGVSASQLAERICCNRQNVYKIFKKPNIDSAQLGLISQALNYDFFAEMSKDRKLSGVDNPEAIREINNRMAVTQFVEVMPRVLKGLGKEPTICFGGALAISDNIPLPDYVLGGYGIEFSLDCLLSEKDNCNFGNCIDIQRVHCDELNIDLDFWQFRISSTRIINLKLDYKTEEEWSGVMKYIFVNYGELVRLRR